MFLIGVALIVLGLFIGAFLMACVAVNTINEMQSLIDARTKKLKDAEDEVVALVEENRELYIVNKDLRFENEELTHNIKKELVTDGKSEN